MSKSTSVTGMTWETFVRQYNTIVELNDGTIHQAMSIKFYVDKKTGVKCHISVKLSDCNISGIGSATRWNDALAEAIGDIGQEKIISDMPYDEYEQRLNKEYGDEVSCLIRVLEEKLEKHKEVKKVVFRSIAGHLD